MLQQLHISNYALIDSLDIDFTAGLNIITGETGAGKSIMLGALSLLLGARADTRAVRAANVKSVVEAQFNVEAYPHLQKWAEENDVDWDKEHCILRRELLPNGRSRAFINDEPVTLTQLETVSRQLIDIHSQHQNQLLSSSEYQLKIIDNLANHADKLNKYSNLYQAYRAAEKRLTDTLKAIERNRSDEEYLRFQLNQLDEPGLVAGEQEELEKERELLANMSQIKQSLNAALTALSDGGHNALHQIAEATESVEDLSEVLDEATSLAERLESARVEIQDIAETLADYDANLGADPAELENIEERLNTIYSLENRHHVDSVEALIELREKIRSDLSALEDSDMTVTELKHEVSAAKKAAQAVAKEITAERTVAAEQFSKELLDVARPLGMANLQCRIAIDPCELNATGADKIEFRFAFNKNQTPIAVGGAASGGEISRLMLSIKSIVAGKLQLPSIIFDEVDTGVSGDVANRMGQMMRRISERLQVITITHLPQVAAKGCSHYKVFKEDDAVATHTRIHRLTDEERTAELALMLSGSTTDEAALANAKSLLKQ
jgi:DNA repair protein RecN (Recombination protein N)